MSKVKFYLKSTSPDKMGEVPVVAQIAWNYKKYRKQLIKVKPGIWNAKQQRVKETPKDRDENKHRKTINSFLNAFESKVNNAFSKLLINDIVISEQFIKELLNSEIEPQKDYDFFSTFDQFIEANKTIRTKGTIKAYGSEKKLLQDFVNETNYPLNFYTINLSLFDELKRYCFEIKGYKHNYFAKVIRQLNTYLNWCNERGIYKGVQHKKFKFTEKDTTVIYLTIDELMKLYRHCFKTEKLIKTRDIYCFACFTGLRISDIGQLNKTHLVNNAIVKTTQKTDTPLVIHLNKFALEILGKYQDLKIRLLPKMSDQKLNDYIKICCKEAGITRPVSKIEYYGNNKKEVQKPIHDYITFHTARKTFVVNSLVMGMNARTIKEFTGHKNDAVFNKYVSIAEDFKKKEMDNTWNKL